MEALGEIGVTLAQWALLLAVPSAAGWVGLKAANRFRRKNPYSGEPEAREWLGWVVFFLALLVLGAMFWTPYQLLGEYNCRDAYDFEACMHPSDSYDA